MRESQVRQEIKRYFRISELVGKRTYAKYGERAWRFLDYRLLYVMLIIRKGLSRRITANTPRLQQRGLRTIVQQLVRDKFRRGVLYISPHMQGKALDFDVEGMTASEVRSWILANQELFPFKIRLERGVSWVHVDVIWEAKNPDVYLFNP